MSRTHEYKNFKEVPEEFCNEEFVEIYEGRYVLFKDGKVWSKVMGKFITPYETVQGRMNGIAICYNHKQVNTTIDHLLKMFFCNLPEIEGVEHKPMFGYEDYYEIYSDGRIWSKHQLKWLSQCVSNTGWVLCCIYGKDGKRKTAYVANEVWKSFKGSINEKLKVAFKDEQKTNCNLSNLYLTNKFKRSNESCKI